jgi:hypothetical protein
MQIIQYTANTTNFHCLFRFRIIRYMFRIAQSILKLKLFKKKHSSLIYNLTVELRSQFTILSTTVYVLESCSNLW